MNMLSDAQAIVDRYLYSQEDLGNRYMKYKHDTDAQDTERRNTETPRRRFDVIMTLLLGQDIISYYRAIASHYTDIKLVYHIYLYY